jgi:hypothetical protein
MRHSWNTVTRPEIVRQYAWRESSPFLTVELQLVGTNYAGSEFLKPSFNRSCRVKPKCVTDVLTAPLRRPSPIAHCPLPIAHCPLPIAHCPLRSRPALRCHSRQPNPPDAHQEHSTFVIWISCWAPADGHRELEPWSFHSTLDRSSSSAICYLSVRVPVHVSPC